MYNNTNNTLESWELFRTFAQFIVILYLTKNLHTHFYCNCSMKIIITLVIFLRKTIFLHRYLICVLFIMTRISPYYCYFFRILYLFAIQWFSKAIRTKVKSNPLSKRRKRDTITHIILFNSNHYNRHLRVHSLLF